MNILHGDSASGTFMQAFIVEQGEVLIFHDVLSCGPLMKYIGVDSWRSFRESFWNDLDHNYDLVDCSYNTHQRNFYNNFEDFKSADEYKLWIGTGLSDQLLLSFIVNLFDFHGLDYQKLSVYQFERASTKNFEVQGLGLLSPEQLKSHPSPYKLTEKQIVQVKQAWDAVTENSPEMYLSYLKTKESVVPLLKRAMVSLFYRYPKASNGLSYWDETLLKYTKKFGPRTAKILGYTMTDHFSELDLVGDFYLFGRLKSLSRPSLNKPLTIMNALNLPLRKTETTILPNGIDALSGSLNVIIENGIDDWVGGVHLDNKSSNVWVRNNNELFHLNS
jgi:hypothetical protein